MSEKYIPPQVPELDGHKLHLHPYCVDWYCQGDINPLTLELGLTSACNHNCTFCAFEYRQKAETIETTAVEALLAELAYGTVKSLHLAGDGEPTLHPDFAHLVKQARKSNLSVGVTTNGSKEHMLLQAAPHLTWCRFSINAGDEETYKRIHRTQKTLKDTLYTVACVAQANPWMTVGIQCLMLDQPEESLRKLIAEAVEREVDYVAFKPYSQHPQATNKIKTTAEKYIQKVVKDTDDGKHTPRITVRSIPGPKTYTGCLAAGTAFWLVCANGEVYPCAQFVGKHEWCMGNIRLQTYQEIRDCVKAKLVVDKLRNLDCRTCRHPCRCDAANRYLHRINCPEPHDVFL